MLSSYYRLEVFAIEKIIGYEGLGPENGKFIPIESAYNYALERIKTCLDEQKEFLEWFYSGNYIEVMEDKHGSL